MFQKMYVFTMNYQNCLPRFDIIIILCCRYLIGFIIKNYRTFVTVVREQFVLLYINIECIYFDRIQMFLVTFYVFFFIFQ